MDKILIIDDDNAIRQSLKNLLSSKYQIFECVGASDTLLCLYHNNIDLCLLDVNLLECNGFELCRIIRKNYSMPIIFITVNDNEESLAEGLLSGGDDYLIKPFSFFELDLRIMAHVRRFHMLTDQSKKQIKSGAYLLDITNRKLYIDQAEIFLTDIECKIVKKLISNVGCLIMRDMLLDELWDSSQTYVDSNTLTVNISRVRKKIVKYQKVSPIQTVYGIGYRWKEEI